MLLRVVRVVSYAPLFLQQLRQVCSAPHRKLLPVQRVVPLSRAKRIPAAALRTPSVAALARGQGSRNTELDKVGVASFSAEPTFDTPANRTLKALLVNIAAQTSSLLTAMRRLHSDSGPAPQYQRRPRREEQLQAIHEQTTAMLRKEPFASVSRIETSSAGLMQVAAQPAYSSACRMGIKALWNGFGGTADRDHLPIKPTWGVYEAWCLVHLMTRLQHHFGGPSWCLQRNSPVTADEAYSLEIADGIAVEMYYQPIFWAGATSPGSLKAWSISRQRRPDIVLAMRRDGEVHYVVLDAKFRQRRTNVLEAMESAHLYHDSLRIGDKRPDWCLLLLPAITEVAHLEAVEFVAQHGVGTISEFSPDGRGVGDCVLRIAEWIRVVANREPI